jgi:UDP-N-acetylmuramate-alanine ligase
MDGDRPGIVDYLCESTRPGDLVLTLGAGDVGQLGAEFLARLGESRDQSDRR